MYSKDIQKLQKQLEIFFLIMKITIILIQKRIKKEKIILPFGNLIMYIAHNLLNILNQFLK